MKKCELKPLMVVELRDKTRGIIVDNMIIQHEGFLCLNEYEEDLLMSTDSRDSDKTKKDLKAFDIMKVYTKTYCLSDINTTNNTLYILFERKEVEE